MCSHDPLPNGDSCELDRGTCDDGECIIEDDSFARDIPVVCRESVFGELFESSFLLRVNPLSAVTPGVPVDAMFSGSVEFPEAVLQAVVDALPGLTQVTLTQLQATVEVRSGASGDGPTMGSNLDLPAMLPLDLETDPVSCRAMGQNTPCVVSPLEVSFAPTVASLQPDGAAASILVGWATGASPNDFDPTSPVGQLGIRLQAIVLAMGVECVAGRVVGGELTPLTDAELLSIPID